MSSVTEVAVPTSDFDGNAPVNGSTGHGVYIFRIPVLATFCPALRAGGSCRFDAGRIVVRGFSGDSACREESASAGIRFGAGGLRPGLCGLLVRP